MLRYHHLFSFVLTVSCVTVKRLLTVQVMEIPSHSNLGSAQFHLSFRHHFRQFPVCFLPKTEGSAWEVPKGTCPQGALEFHLKFLIVTSMSLEVY